MSSPQLVERSTPRRTPRKPAARIINPATHPERWVTRTVAADFLGFPQDLRALNVYIGDGSLPFRVFGRTIKIHVNELVRFKRWLLQKRVSLI
jgi:hypothetical protein